MFYRNILKELDNWKQKRERKPLIIRGARQTGKTVAVNMFAQKFSNFISLNLERESDKLLFERSESLEQTLHAIELAKGKAVLVPDTLLFIDEIQNSGKAIQFLRFFYEDYPTLAVVAAGSLLEAVMAKEGFSFPVGRVEFLYMFPVTFDEYLKAVGKDKLYEGLCNITIKEKPSAMLHKLASEMFIQYVAVGGMPAVVADFMSKRSFKSIADIKEDLITTLKDDVTKYSRLAEAKYLRHVIEYAPYSVGERIKYEKFGNSDYHSREIKRAFDLLEFAMIVQRIYGSHSVLLPIEPNFRVSPKVLYLDSGLVVHKMGLSEEALFVDELSHLFRGSIAEQIVGQTFLSMDLHKRSAPYFWYRNVPGSTSEVDYLFQYKGVIIPVEVKSGKSGRLRSLHQFLMASPSKAAIRIYSGELDTDKISVGGRSFDLVSVPFYLQWRMSELLESA